MKTYTEKEILQLMDIHYTKRQGKDRLIALCQAAGLIIKPVADTLKGKGQTIQYQIVQNNFLKPNEVWTDCIYDNDYEVSNQGRVRRKKNKRLLGFDDKKGYVKVALKDKKTYGVHRLVYFSFNPKDFQYENIFTIDHINGVRTDNSLNNLRPLTNLQNNQQKGKNQDAMKTIVAQLVSKYGYTETINKLNSIL